jgi:putative restriction endonuclease
MALTPFGSQGGSRAKGGAGPPRSIPHDEIILHPCYRGKDPQHRDNVGLRKCMQLQKPLIYIAGIAPSHYLVAGPAYIVNDDPQHLVFTVQVDDPTILRQPHDATTAGEIALRRRYITTEVQQRVHQRTFRERVLKAYQEQCAICRLKHQELLEAAHILPDNDPRGEPIVSNGLALCNLHHAAYDRNILGVTPELKVQVRLDVLQEKDGPMLQWGLQHFHGADLYVPRRQDLKPNPEFLADRYAIFQQAH